MLCEDFKNVLMNWKKRYKQTKTCSNNNVGMRVLTYRQALARWRKHSATWHNK